MVIIFQLRTYKFVADLRGKSASRVLHDIAGKGLISWVQIVRIMLRGNVLDVILFNIIL